MNILIIDAQGGGIGKQLVSSIKESFPNFEITAVGTNRPIGIVITDSLYGEITEKMAVAIGKSSAKRILIPVNQCDNIIAGVQNSNINHLIKCVIEEIINF